MMKLCELHEGAMRISEGDSLTWGHTSLVSGARRGREDRWKRRLIGRWLNRGTQVISAQAGGNFNAH